MLLLRTFIAFVFLKPAAMYEPIRVAMYGFMRVPFHPNIPDPVMVDPSAEHLTEESVYIPPSVRPHVNVDVNPNLSLSRRLEILYSEHRVRRWRLPSWDWVGGSQNTSFPLRVLVCSFFQKAVPSHTCRTRCSDPTKLHVVLRSGSKGCNAKACVVRLL